MLLFSPGYREPPLNFPLSGPGIIRVTFQNLLWVCSPVITASVFSAEVVSAIMMFCGPCVSSCLLLEARGLGTRDPAGPESHGGGTLSPLALLLLTVAMLSPPSPTRVAAS